MLKYLVCRVIYKAYHGVRATLQFLFIKNTDIHMHDTQQRGYYHIPLCTTNLGKCILQCFGALLWNHFDRNSTKLYVAYH